MVSDLVLREERSGGVGLTTLRVAVGQALRVDLPELMRVEGHTLLGALRSREAGHDLSNDGLVRSVGGQELLDGEFFDVHGLMIP